MPDAAASLVLKLPIHTAQLGAWSIWHWLIVLAIVLVLFGGGGKLSRLMGDMGKGIKAFRSGLKEGETGAPTRDAEGRPILENDPANPATGTSSTTAERPAAPADRADVTHR